MYIYTSILFIALYAYKTDFLVGEDEKEKRQEMERSPELSQEAEGQWARVGNVHWSSLTFILTITAIFQALLP